MTKLIMEGVLPEKEYEIKGDCSIGRDKDNDIIIPDKLVSRRHARIEVRDNRVILYDNDSLNGTMVNNERIKERLLKNGDEIKLGTIILKFCQPQDVETTKATTIVFETSLPVENKRKKGRGLVLAVGVSILAIIAAMVVFLPQKSHNLPEHGGKIKVDKIATLPPAMPAHDKRAAEIIKEAEIEIKMAQRLYKEKNISQGNLYQAIVKWNTAAEKLGQINPSPQIYEETISILKTARQEIDQLINKENDAAYRCWQTANYQGVLDHLYNVIELIPDPNDPRNKEAKERILKYEKEMK